MKAAILYIVLSRTPGKKWERVSDPIPRTEAAKLVAEQWAKRNHARRVLPHTLAKPKVA